MAEEDRLGPAELRKTYCNNGSSTGITVAEEHAISEEEHDLEIGNNDYEEKEKRAREKVRKYQVNRLRYYYAVAEFSSTDAADTVYKNCDGTEYELSGTRYFLSFSEFGSFLLGAFGLPKRHSCLGALGTSYRL